MQIGAENRTKLIAAIALMALAVVLIARWVFSSEPTSAASPTVTSTSAIDGLDLDQPRPAAAARPPARHGKKAGNSARSLDPRLRYDWLKASEDTKYEGSGRNIFLAQVDIPKPIVNPVIDRRPVPPPQPTGPPPPPPIDLKFFGFASHPGEPKKIFLKQGEDVFIASEGETIDRRYKILRITPTAVEVEDVLNNNRQQIPLSPG